MKLVLDTNIVISGFLWRKAPRQLIDAAVEGSIELVTSAPLIDELRRVISRPKFARKLAERGVSINSLVERYARLAVMVKPAQILRTVISDADDDSVLACALAAQVDLIVSGDAHLLNLKRYHGMRILSPAHALAAVDSV